MRRRFTVAPVAAAVAMACERDDTVANGLPLRFSPPVFDRAGDVLHCVAGVREAGMAGAGRVGGRKYSGGSSGGRGLAERDAEGRGAPARSACAVCNTAACRVRAAASGASHALAETNPDRAGDFRSDAGPTGRFPPSGVSCEGYTNAAMWVRAQNEAVQGRGRRARAMPQPELGDVSTMSGVTDVFVSRASLGDVAEVLKRIKLGQNLNARHAVRR